MIEIILKIVLLVVLVFGVVYLYLSGTLEEWSEKLQNWLLPK